MAFGFDCFSYLFSAWTLAKWRLLHARREAQSVLRAVGEGLRMVWNDVPLRLCFIYWGIVSLFIGGTMQVAIPVLARDLHGASTLGMLMGAHGAGTLLGMGVAAIRRAFALRRIRRHAAADRRHRRRAGGAAGLRARRMASVPADAGAWPAGRLHADQRLHLDTAPHPPQMMGRAMSIFMFIFMGLAPLSAAAAGWILTHISLSQMFVGGIILVLFAAAGVSADADPQHHHQRIARTTHGNQMAGRLYLAGGDQ
jgi:MFS family permease